MDENNGGLGDKVLKLFRLGIHVSASRDRWGHSKKAPVKTNASVVLASIRALQLKSEVQPVATIRAVNTWRRNFCTSDVCTYLDDYSTMSDEGVRRSRACRRKRRIQAPPAAR